MKLVQLWSLRTLGMIMACVGFLMAGISPFVPIKYNGADTMLILLIGGSFMGIYGILFAFGEVKEESAKSCPRCRCCKCQLACCSGASALDS